MIKKALLAAMNAATFGGIAVPAQAQQHGIVIVREAPPPPRHEVRPDHVRRNQVWAPGHWDWNGRRYVWVEGRWLRDRPGYTYREARWVQRDGHWVQERAQWSRGGPHGDRDRDGIANHNDSDKDGDGVRNSRDRHPNDPNRS